MLYRILYNGLGNLRGFQRGAIRRAVEGNAVRSPEALRTHQAERLAARIRGAVESFSAYREKVTAAGLAPQDLAALEPAQALALLPRLPVWTRQDQNRLFAALPGPPRPGAFPHATGGSTGQPTRFYMTRESYEWRTAVSNRGYAWAGAEPGRRVFFVWGAPVEPARGPARCIQTLHHALERRRFFNSFDFSPDRMRQCCRAIDRFRPDALVGYAGNLVQLARFVRQHPGILRHRPASVIPAAEGLHPGQRERLQSCLGGEVFMSYGSREFMLIGMECRAHQGYHLSADNLRVEVADDDGAPCAPGRVGRILVTDLHNDANPFVRYEIGDLGVMAEAPCPCGLPFPRLRAVEGRRQDYVLKPDGSRLNALFLPHLIKEFEDIDGYQLSQTAPDAVTLKLVTPQDLRDPLTRSLKRHLDGWLGGGMHIEIRRVEALTRGPSGKILLVERTFDHVCPDR